LVDVVVIFFFSSRRRHTRCSRDWSSDVCSSDLSIEVDGKAAASVLDVDVWTEARLVFDLGVSSLLLGADPGASETPALTEAIFRSEERRVGKECRSRWSPYH